MKVHHLERALKQIDLKRGDYAAKAGEVQKKLSDETSAGKARVKKFRDVREQLLKNKTAGTIGQEELLLKLLQGQKKNITLAGKKKSELQRELGKIQKELLQLSQKKEKASGLLEFEKLKAKNLLGEVRSEEENLMYFLSSEKDELSLSGVKEEGSSSLRLALIERSEPRQFISGGFGDIRSDFVAQRAESGADQFIAGDHCSYSQGQQHHASYQSQEQSNAPAPSHNSFEELCERLHQMETWSTSSASHMTCSYRLASGGEINLQIERQQNGRLQIVLISHERHTAAEISKSLHSLTNELGSAGFSNIHLTHRDVTVRRKL